MTPDELKTLRSESSGFLSSVQELPGFAERRNSLPEVPAEVGSLAYWSLQRLSHGGDKTGASEWRTWTNSDPPSKADIMLLAALQKDGFPVRVDLEDGSTIWRAPAPIHITDAETRDEIERYRAAVARFNSRFLLGAQWSAAALHDALRRDEPIQLPRASTPSPVLIDRNRSLPQEEVDHVFGLLANPHVQQEELPRSRERTWSGALKAVATRIAEQSLSNTERSSWRRARRLLNAAVNGQFDLEQPVDLAYAEDIEKWKAFWCARDAGTPGDASVR